MAPLKKITLSTSIYLAFVISTNAQATFTYTDFAPQSGDQYIVRAAQIQGPGPAGSNQTWNFSSSTLTSTLTYNITPVSAIPAGSQYPNANLGIGTGGYDMLQITGTDYLSYGNALTPGMAQFIFSDPEKYFVFPMNYQYSFSDLFQGIDVASNPSVYEWGGDTVTYDGYGTLITPTSTYNNVIRIHRQISYTDSTGLGPNIYCSGDYYYWFAPGYRYPILRYWYIPCTPGGLGSGTEFLQSITIGIPEQVSTDSEIKSFPNPFQSTITLNATNANSGDIVTISDVSGRLVKSFPYAGAQMTTDLSDLEDGVYIMGINGSQTRLIKAR
jgi:Secretion system C-terminal sorting domain